MILKLKPRDFVGNIYTNDNDCPVARATRRKVGKKAIISVGPYNIDTWSENGDKTKYNIKYFPDDFNDDKLKSKKLLYRLFNLTIREVVATKVDITY